MNVFNTHIIVERIKRIVVTIQTLKDFIIAILASIALLLAVIWFQRSKDIEPLIVCLSIVVIIGGLRGNKIFKIIVILIELIEFLLSVLWVYQEHNSFEPGISIILCMGALFLSWTDYLHDHFKLSSSNDNSKEIENKVNTRIKSNEDNSAIKTKTPITIFDVWEKVLNHILQSVVLSQLEGIEISNDPKNLEKYIKTYLTGDKLIFPKSISNEISAHLNAYYYDYTQYIYGLKKDSNTDLSSNKNISIALPANFIGDAAILYYLRDIMKYNITINCNFPYALFIIKQMLIDNFGDPTDFIILASAPATEIFKGRLKKTDYRYSFKILMAPCKQKIFTPKNKKVDLKKGGLFFFPQFEDIFVTPELQLKKLMRNDIINKNRIIKVNDVPSSTFQHLQDEKEDNFPMLWEPMITFCEMLKIGIPINTNTTEIVYDRFDTLLFVHEDFEKANPKLTKSFLSNIYQTAYTLRTKPDERRKAIDCMLADKEYVETLAKSVGIGMKDYDNSDMKIKMMAILADLDKSIKY